MVDLTRAVDVAAKGIYEEIASAALISTAGETDIPDWEDLAQAEKFRFLEAAIAPVNALKDAGLLKEQTNG